MSAFPRASCRGTRGRRRRGDRDRARRRRRPDLVVEHIGSTAVPGLPGKGIVDLVIATEPDDVPLVAELLFDLGFGPQPGQDPFPPTRPMLVGSMVVDGTLFRIHLHVQPRGDEVVRDLAFRDALRADPALMAAYAELKIRDRGRRPPSRASSTRTASRPGSPMSTAGSASSAARSSRPRRSASSAAASSAGCSAWRRARWAIGSPSWTRIRTARRRPSPTAWSSAGYDDVGARAPPGRHLARVITYELEHVASAVVDALDARGPGPARPLSARACTQDRIAERHFIEVAGATVAPWREVRTTEDLRGGRGRARPAAAAQGRHRRLRRTQPAPDRDARRLDGALDRLGRPAGSRCSPRPS